MRDRVSDLEKAYAVHEAVCAQRYTEITKSLSRANSLMLFGFAIIALLTMLGPHDGMLAFLSKLSLR